MIRPQGLVVVVAVLAVGAAGNTARAGSEITKVMGSIEIGAGERSGDLSTVNGSIRIGENAVVGDVKTVNGTITVERHASAAALTTVNGSIHAHAAVHVGGTMHTVNGALSLDDGAEVNGQLSNVNGAIRVAAAHVAGGIDTANGAIDLGPNARVDGGIHVEPDSNSFHFGFGDTPRVVVRAGSVIGGTLKFERAVKLYVSDRATIGAVQGATPIKFSGEPPPQ